MRHTNEETVPKVGYLLFSLDTEMAWGYYDCLRPGMFSSDGSEERRNMGRLLDLLDEFGIVATFAVVGHLFYEGCEECRICPVLDWRGRYPAFDYVYRTHHPLWYGADMVEMLASRGSGHEIAFHGYTHRLFAEGAMSLEEAGVEIREWLRVAARQGLAGQSVVFPRNRVGHLDLFRDAGFLCYRGPQAMHPTYSIPILGKLLNRLDLVLQLFAPRLYDLPVSTEGLVNLPASQWLFRIDRRIEGVLDRLGLPTFRLRRITGAVEMAAREGKLLHLWAHPHEFRTDADFQKLRHILAAVARQVDEGNMLSVGMAELARAVLEEACGALSGPTPTQASPITS